MSNSNTDKENIIKREEEKLVKIRRTYLQRYPLFFVLGGTFGLVCTFYGFEKLIDKVGLFNDNPWILLALGLSLLAVTGSFYNKLQ